MTPVNRRPAGSPDGGKFASGAGALEADVTALLNNPTRPTELAPTSQAPRRTAAPKVDESVVAAMTPRARRGVRRDLNRPIRTLRDGDGRPTRLGEVIDAGNLLSRSAQPVDGGTRMKYVLVAESETLPGGVAYFGVSKDVHDAVPDAPTPTELSLGVRRR